MPIPKSNRVIAFAVGLAGVAADQLSKLWIAGVLKQAGNTLRLPGPIDLTLVLNHSNAFGMMPEFGAFGRWAMAAVNLIAAGVLVTLVITKYYDKLHAIGFALIAAGAVGNAADRIRLGAVVDFFDASTIGFIWVFNVADAAIDIGAGLVVLSSLRSRLNHPEIAEK